MDEHEGATPTPMVAVEAPEAGLRDRVLQALMQVYDPELGINIVDLGLVYSVDVSDEGTWTSRTASPRWDVRSARSSKTRSAPSWRRSRRSVRYGPSSSSGLRGPPS